MKKIALISCVKKKKSEACAAKDLYVSNLFTYQYEYAKQWGADVIYILSAKYGLLAENEVIEPYDKTLNGERKVERQKWTNNVYVKLCNAADVENDEFLILAGINYCEFLIEKLPHYALPLKGLNMGQRLQFLKNALSEQQEKI